MPTDRAHLVDRSLVPDPDADPLRVVRLCRHHHDLYDDHRLNLLPFLEPRHRAELARAVEIFGLIRTLERVSGGVWLPASNPIPWEEANCTLKHRVRELQAERQAVLDVVNLYGDGTLHAALDNIGWPERANA
jgi:hypothetical protein